MNKKLIFSKLKRHWIYTVVLLLTLGYFFYKGVWYWILGSWLPLVIILILLALLVFSAIRSEKAFRKSIILWATLMILWAFVRLVFSVADTFIKPIPESHIHEQLGIQDNVLSLIFLISGIYLLSFRKRIFSSKMKIDVV